MKTRMQKTVLCVLLALVPALLNTQTVNANELTFEFTGTVTIIDTLGNPDPFGGTVVVGTPVAGSYTFDPDAPDIDPTTGRGFYRAVGPEFTFEMGLGGNSVSGPLAQILVTLPPYSSGNLYSAAGYGPFGSGVVSQAIVLQNNSGPSSAVSVNIIV